MMLRERYRVCWHHFYILNARFLLNLDNYAANEFLVDVDIT
jgi:hypothetical protein